MTVITDAAKQRKTSLGIIAAFAAVYVLWGMTYLGIRVAVETIPPFLMAGARQFLAGAILIGIMLARGAKLPRLVHLRSALIIGAFMLVGGNGLVTVAEQRVPSGLAALMVATIPMWVTMFDWLLFRGKRPVMQVVIGLVIGFIGIMLLVDPTQIGASGEHDLFGLILLIAASVLWAIGGLYSRRAPLPKDMMVGTATEMLFGGAMMLVLGTALGETGRLDWAAISMPSILAFIYLTIFGSIVGYSAYIYLMKNVDPAKAASTAYVNPVIAVFMGWLVLGEVVTLQTVTAAGVILVAVLLINTKPDVLRRAFRPRLVPQAEGAMGD